MKDKYLIIYKRALDLLLIDPCGFMRCKDINVTLDET